MPRSPPEKGYCTPYRVPKLDCIKCAMHTQEVAYEKNTNDTGG